MINDDLILDDTGWAERRACRKVAKAWRAWLEDAGPGPDGLLELPDICDACAGPATHLDAEGTPLCDDCWEAC